MCIRDSNHIIGGDGVTVYLDRVGAILLSVGHAHGVGGKLAGLTGRHKSGADLVCKNRAADKSARFNTHYFSKMCIRDRC